MTYHVQYAIKASAANQPVQVKVEDTSYSPCYLEDLTVGTQWLYVDTTFTSSLAGAGALKFCLADVSQECTIYVKDISITLDGIPMPQFAEGKEVDKVSVGRTITLDIEHSSKVQSKYDSYTFVSSDEDIVMVAADGTLTAKAEGTATVTVTSVLGTSFTFTVEVEKAQSTGGGSQVGGNGTADNSGNTENNNAPESNKTPAQKTDSDNKKKQEKKDNDNNTTVEEKTEESVEDNETVVETESEESVPVEKQDSEVNEEPEMDSPVDEGKDQEKLEIEDVEAPLENSDAEKGMSPAVIIAVIAILVAGLEAVYIFRNKFKKQI
jgi:hypothetical protein